MVTSPSSHHRQDTEAPNSQGTCQAQTKGPWCTRDVVAESEAWVVQVHSETHRLSAQKGSAPLPQLQGRAIGASLTCEGRGPILDDGGHQFVHTLHP